jgi:hypothetical protein
MSTGSSAIAAPACPNIRPSQQATIAEPLVEIKHNWLIKNVQHSRDGDEYTSELFPCTNCSTR